MLRLFVTLFKVLVVLALIAAGVTIYYVQRPLPQARPIVDLEVLRGSSMREVARQVSAAGIDVSPMVLTWLARASGHDSRIKAGNYQISEGITPWGLIELLTSGSNAYAELALIEGWNFRRLRAALDGQPDLRHDTLGLPDADILARLNIPEAHPEGLFFPDTYYVVRGTSDLDVLRRAHEQMEKVLQREWEKRSPDLPLSTPYEALVLASVVEKETGVPQDRDRVASVFVNRLRAGMPLQSDPTVIYGMGTAYDGNLRKRDLQTDTPYNSYTRRGLPPTPVAMPGLAALRATLNPARTDFFYFVSRGNGTSEFSRTLDEHNRAVARYIKGRG
ncbi:MAG: endolytic transglycosylase MltG [Rhodocyclaceae bacterium]